MKKFLAYCLTAAVVFGLAGCGVSQSGDNWTAFYYPRSEIIYGVSDGVIGPENRQLSEEAAAVETILQQYLLGPETDGFLSPFPKNCSVISVLEWEDGITITLSDEFAKLTGMELSIACSSLALTVWAITGQDSVTIQTESSMLDGRESVTVACSALNLTDGYIPPPDP